MKLRHAALLTLLTALAAVGLAAPAPAAAIPIWNLDIHHNQTHFEPGGLGQYTFDVNNVGNADSSGPISLKIDLPPGLTVYYAVEYNNDFGSAFVNWSCPYSEGSSSVTCTTSSPVHRHNLTRRIYISVFVDPGASGTLTTQATLEGGGASPITVTEPTPISSQPAGFGVVPSSFVPDAFETDGLTPERRASSHPALTTFPFDFNTIYGGNGQAEQAKEVENVRDLRVDLPVGFLGNPTAVDECTQAEFGLHECSPSSQVGREDLAVYPLGASEEERYYTISTAVYNLAHPRGVVADLAFVFAGNPVHIKASLDPANRYAITSEVPSINETLPPFNQKLTLWGVPGDHSHDSERCRLKNVQGFDTSNECAIETAPKPFLTIPAECESDNTMRLHHYDSWDNPGVFGPEIDYTMPGKMTDCDKPRFEPDVEIEPTGRQANTPTGLDVHVKVAQNENPNAPATPPVKRFTVKLPEGMSFSPSFADGLCRLHPGPDAIWATTTRCSAPMPRASAKSRCTTPPAQARGRLDVFGGAARQPLQLDLRPALGLARHRRTRCPDQDPGPHRRR